MLPPWLAQRFPPDNPAAALVNLLHLAGFAITATTVREAVATHPVYPAVSFATLTDLLRGWSIDSLPLRLTPADLAHVRLPALVLLDDNGGSFGVVHEVTGTGVLYLHPRTGWHRATLPGFAARWPGAALLVAPSDRREEPGYAQKREAEALQRRLDAAQCKVETLPGLLSDAECDYLLGLAPRLDVPVCYFEYFQCVRYEVGQFYGEHLDTLDEATPPGMAEVARRGQQALGKNHHGGAEIVGWRWASVCRKILAYYGLIKEGHF